MAHILRLILAGFLALVSGFAIASLQPVVQYVPSVDGLASHPVGDASGSKSGACSNGSGWALANSSAGGSTSWDGHVCNILSKTTGQPSGYTLYIVQIPAACPANSSFNAGGTCECSTLYQENADSTACVKKPLLCEPGYVDDGTGVCVIKPCAPDEIRSNGICVKEPGCPAGQERINGVCKDTGCPAGKNYGQYEGIAENNTMYICEGGCSVRIRASICISYKDAAGNTITECTGDGIGTGAKCSGSSGSGGTGGDAGGGTGGTGGTGGDTGGGTGGGTGGTGGDGTGGTGGGTGSGSSGGNTGGDAGGGGTTGGGTTGGGTGGTGGTSGNNEPTHPAPGSGLKPPNPPKPVDPTTDACPAGYHKYSATICVQDDKPPDDNGACPDGFNKVGGKCVASAPAGGTGSGSGAGGDCTGPDCGKDTSAFGGTCDTGFTCDGDAIQCAIAYEQHRTDCKIFNPDKDVNSVVNKALAGTDGFNMDALRANSEKITVSNFDQTGFGWGRACPADPVISLDFGGHTEFSIPFSRICGPLSVLSLAGVGITLLGSLIWVLGGKNNRG